MTNRILSNYNCAPRLHHSSLVQVQSQFSFISIALSGILVHKAALQGARPRFWSLMSKLGMATSEASWDDMRKKPWLVVGWCWMVGLYTLILKVYRCRSVKTNGVKCVAKLLSLMTIRQSSWLLGYKSTVSGAMMHWNKGFWEMQILRIHVGPSIAL